MCSMRVGSGSGTGAAELATAAAIGIGTRLGMASEVQVIVSYEEHQGRQPAASNERG